MTSTGGPCNRCWWPMRMPTRRSSTSSGPHHPRPDFRMVGIAVRAAQRPLREHACRGWCMTPMEFLPGLEGPAVPRRQQLVRGEPHPSRRPHRHGLGPVGGPAARPPPARAPSVGHPQCPEAAADDRPRLHAGRRSDCGLADDVPLLVLPPAASPPGAASMWSSKVWASFRVSTWRSSPTAIPPGGPHRRHRRRVPGHRSGSTCWTSCRANASSSTCAPPISRSTP